MQVRDACKVLVGLAVAAATVVVPAAAANAADTTESYDEYSAGQLVGNDVTAFTLGDVHYVTDGSIVSRISTSADGAPLSSDPSDGVLAMNVGVFTAPLTSVTISLANGHLMNVTSFDFDSFLGAGTIEVIPDADTTNQVSLVGNYSGTVDLSANANFDSVMSIEILNVGGNGMLLPTLDNFVYADMGPAAPQLTPSIGSTSFVEADNPPSTPVVVDGGLTVSDSGASTLGSATVEITGGFQSGEDVLAFTNDGSTMGNITGSYSAGVLTLTSTGATATLAQWQSALRSITYTDTSVTPDTTTRTVSFTVADGVGTTSNTVTRTVTVTATDQAPIVTTTGGTTNYVPGASAVTIDGGVTVSDVDNATQMQGIVSIDGGFQAGDTLSFVNDGATMGNIDGLYNATTHILLLTSTGSTATNAQWSNALSSVMFSSTISTTGNRTIIFETLDGTKSSSAATHTVAVTAPPAGVTPGPPTYTGITRVAGSDRIATSVAASQREFPGTPSTFTANAVVLVGTSDAIDGMTGAPLAAAARAPVLYIDATAVPTNVLAEIRRLLGSSGTVYLLGGTVVISASVESQLNGLGYTVQRIAGTDRYATAVAIANQVVSVKGSVSAVFEATGLNYADALVAAPAAARGAGVVLLTEGSSQSAATSDWLAAHDGITRYAVGGPAAAADQSATAVSGADRYATADGVATTFFSGASQVALANGTAWPDAAVAAASTALYGAPLLLITTDGLPTPVTVWLGANPLTSVTAYGGTTRISDGVLDSVATITGLPLG